MTDAELIERIARRLWAAQGDTMREWSDVGAHWKKVFRNLAREILPLVKALDDSIVGHEVEGAPSKYTDRLKEALRPWVGQET